MLGLIGFLIVGLIAGAIARFLVPGRDPMGCLGTMLLGVVGSYVGGSLYSVIRYGELNLRQAESFIGSVVGAVVALLVLRMVGRR